MSGPSHGSPVGDSLWNEKLQVGEARRLGDEPRRLEQLVAVRVAGLEDPRRQRVRGEDDVRVGAADAVGEQLDEAGLVVPALDEAELRAAGERTLELLPVARDRERGVVRREHEPDDLLGSGRDRRIGRVRDARRPVLHPGEDRQPELGLERRARLLGDRVERRGVLDAEPPVALDEIGEVLRRDRAAAADVGVVRGDVRQPLGRAVRHEDDRALHAARRVAPDELRESREHVRVGLGQDAVTEVEDVARRGRPRGAGRRTPPTRRAPTGRAARRARDSPGPRAPRRRPSRRRRAGCASRRRSRSRRRTPSRPAAASSRRCRNGSSARPPPRARAPSRARRTLCSRSPRARRPRSRRAGSRRRRRRPARRRSARTARSAAPSARARSPARGT